MKNKLVAGFLVAMLALAGVACSSDGGGETEGGTATEGGATATEATS